VNAAEFVCVPAVVPAGLEYVEIRLGARVVGSVDLRACAVCQLAVVSYIRVAPPYRRRGLATAVVRTVLADRPGYWWTTSPLEDTACARGFWASIEAAGWPGELGAATESCPHMREADQRTP
jgi:GNAT superfamily N-acetyltransferase